jgi:uncharacterized protein YjgD (DUF1641 family)
MTGMANDKSRASPMVDEAEEMQKAPSTLDEAALNDLVEMINFLASARDAMSDEMVARMARTASEGITLLDRLTRNEGVMRLLQVLDRPESQYLLMSLAEALGKMSRELARIPPAKGGISGIWRVVREPGTQEGLRAVSMLGKYWNEALRDLHRRGG